MKFTYMGFSQAKLVEYNLDLVDAAILRYFIDFKDSGAMIKEIVGEEMYYWVNYEILLNSNPILKIKSKDVVRRRFKKLVDSNVLIHYHKKIGGRYSFYGVGENYKNLISDHTTQKSQPYDSKVGRDTTQKSQPYDSKVGTKHSSIKDSSIKNTHLLKHTLEDEKNIEKTVCVLEKKVTFEEAKKILKTANDDVDLVKEKYDVAKASGYKNLVAFMIKAIKEDYRMPKEQKDKPRSKVNTKFHNFEQRTSKYTPEQLEKMVTNKERRKLNED